MLPYLSHKRHLTIVFGSNQQLKLLNPLSVQTLQVRKPAALSH